MSVHAHHADAPSSVNCAVLTISDTRTPDTDGSGSLARELLAAAGHSIIDHGLVPDEPADIASIVADWAARPGIDIIITTGGTGIARRDSSVDALRALFRTELPGFGELFRRLSFDEIGPAAMLSRATAGIIDRSAVFVLPGSTHAVRLAITQLILPQIGHIARELAK